MKYGKVHDKKEAPTQVFRESTRGPAVEHVDATLLASAWKMGSVEWDSDIPLQDSPLEGNRIIILKSLPPLFYLWLVRNARALH